MLYCVSMDLSRDWTRYPEKRHFPVERAIQVASIVQREKYLVLYIGTFTCYTIFCLWLWIPLIFYTKLVHRR